jgi:Rrf2 family protein
MSSPNNTQFSVAVHAVVLLGASPDSLLRSETLAASARVGPVYVRQIMGRLRDARIVASRPGPGGGWSLTADPRKLTLAEIWRALRGDASVLALHEGAGDCNTGDALRLIDRGVARAIEDELRNTTIADLVAAHRAGLAGAAAPASPGPGSSDGAEEAVPSAGARERSG